MPASRKRVADYTGRLNETLLKEKEVEVREAAQRVAMVSAEVEGEKDIIVDHTGDDSTPIPEVELRQVELNTPYRMIRVNADIDQMTYGRSVIDSGDYDNPDMSQRRPAVMGPMQFHSFKEGQLARVTKEMAEHLDKLGYISYMSNS